MLRVVLEVALQYSRLIRVHCLVVVYDEALQCSVDGSVMQRASLALEVAIAVFKI